MNTHYSGQLCVLCGVEVQNHAEYYLLCKQFGFPVRSCAVFCFQHELHQLVNDRSDAVRITFKTDCAILRLHHNDVQAMPPAKFL